MSAIEDAAAQDGQVALQGAQQLQLPPAPQAGTSMFAQWAAMGPWMQPSSVQQGNGITSIQPAWKLKVIRCLDRKLKAFKPDYAPEEPDEVDENEGWNVAMTRGSIRKTKKGKSSVRGTKQDFSADGSYGRWIAEGAQLGPAAKRSTDVARPLQQVGKSGCPIAIGKGCLAEAPSTSERRLTSKQ